VEAKPQEILICETEDNKVPFSEWMDGLAGQEIEGIIYNRLDRIEKGIFGNCHSVGEGVSELVIDYGPGYRVYFGRLGDDQVILLTGGTKNGQDRDIAKAKELWRDFNAEAH
jgi:putative addiction module killer protein